VTSVPRNRINSNSFFKASGLAANLDDIFLFAVINQIQCQSAQPQELLMGNALASCPAHPSIQDARSYTCNFSRTLWNKKNQILRNKKSCEVNQLLRSFNIVWHPGTSVFSFMRFSWLP